MAALSLPFRRPSRWRGFSLTSSPGEEKNRKPIVQRYKFMLLPLTGHISAAFLAKKTFRKKKDNFYSERGWETKEIRTVHDVRTNWLEI